MKVNKLALSFPFSFLSFLNVNLFFDNFIYICNVLYPLINFLYTTHACWTLKGKFQSNLFIYSWVHVGCVWVCVCIMYCVHICVCMCVEARGLIILTSYIEATCMTCAHSSKVIISSSWQACSRDPLFLPPWTHWHCGRPTGPPSTYMSKNHLNPRTHAVEAHLFCHS